MVEAVPKEAPGFWHRCRHRSLQEVHRLADYALIGIRRCLPTDQRLDRTKNNTLPEKLQDIEPRCTDTAERASPPCADNRSACDHCLRRMWTTHRFAYAPTALAERKYSTKIPSLVTFVIAAAPTLLQRTTSAVLPAGNDDTVRKRKRPLRRASPKGQGGREDTTPNTLALTLDSIVRRVAARDAKNFKEPWVCRRESLLKRVLKCGSSPRRQRPRIPRHHSRSAERSGFFRHRFHRLETTRPWL